MKYFKILCLLFILLTTILNYAISDNCEDKILEVKTTSIPDEFQANVILNSFLKDQIIDDMTSWFIESHFPFGNSTAWHKINLETSTIDLNKYGNLQKPKITTETKFHLKVNNKRTREISIKEFSSKKSSYIKFINETIDPSNFIVQDVRGDNDCFKRACSNKKKYRWNSH